MLIDLSKEKINILIKKRRNFLLIGWHRFEEISETMKSHGFLGNLPTSRRRLKVPRFHRYELHTNEGEKARMMLVRMTDEAIMVTFPGSMQNR